MLSITDWAFSWPISVTGRLVGVFLEVEWVEKGGKGRGGEGGGPHVDNTLTRFSHGCGRYCVLFARTWNRA